MEVEGVLQEQLVDGGAGGVGLTALGNWIFAISLWVNVVGAAGQQNSLHPCQQLRDLLLALVERNDHRRGSGSLQGGYILRQSDRSL